MVGRSLLGGGMSKFLVCGGLAGGLPHPPTPFPQPPRRETPAGCIYKTWSAQYASGVEGFMQNLFSFLISLVVTSTLRP